MLGFIHPMLDSLGVDSPLKEVFVNGDTEPLWSVAEGNGPVNALDCTAQDGPDECVFADEEFNVASNIPKRLDDLTDDSLGHVIVLNREAQIVVLHDCHVLDVCDDKYC